VRETPKAVARNCGSDGGNLMPSRRSGVSQQWMGMPEAFPCCRGKTLSMKKNFQLWKDTCGLAIFFR